MVVGKSAVKPSRTSGPVVQSGDECGVSSALVGQEVTLALDQRPHDSSVEASQVPWAVRCLVSSATSEFANERTMLWVGERLVERPLTTCSRYFQPREI